MQQPRMLSAKEIANEVVEVGKYKVSRKIVSLLFQVC